MISEEEKKEIYREAFREWGLEKQLDIAIEECAELIQAICKFKRKGGSELASVAEEIADVEIMIEQMKLMLPGQAGTFEQNVNTWKTHKLKRLKERLE